MNVIIGGADVGQQLSSHRGVDRVSFTGSDGVGARIMAQAAQNLTGVTLELGGKSPSMVMPDVDVHKIAVEMHLRWSRNGGQGCAALARLLVHEDKYEEFLDAGASAFDQMVVGDPWDPATNIGPMIRPDHRARVLGFIDDSVADGGKKLLEVTQAAAGEGLLRQSGAARQPAARRARRAGGDLRPGRGDPAVQGHRGRDPAGQRHRLRPGRQRVVQRPESRHAGSPLQIRAGTVWINGGGAMRPDAPFGGYGRSGVGRELGEWGMREYLEVKHLQWRV